MPADREDGTVVTGLLDVADLPWDELMTLPDPLRRVIAQVNAGGERMSAFNNYLGRFDDTN